MSKYCPWWKLDINWCLMWEVSFKSMMDDSMMKSYTFGVRCGMSVSNQWWMIQWWNRMYILVSDVRCQFQINDEWFNDEIGCTLVSDAGCHFESIMVDSMMKFDVHLASDVGCQFQINDGWFNDEIGCTLVSDVGCHVQINDGWFN